MRTIPLLLLALLLAGCIETAHFHGSAIYVVSTPGEPSQSDALEQSGVMCAVTGGGGSKVRVLLSDGCKLDAKAAEGHGASILPGQRCLLPLREGARDLTVTGGSLMGDANRGVEVSITGHPVDRPESSITYHLVAGPPKMGGKGCEQSFREMQS